MSDSPANRFVISKFLVLEYFVQCHFLERDFCV
jgi:hypothetical protein